MTITLDPVQLLIGALIACATVLVIAFIVGRAVREIRRTQVEIMARKDDLFRAMWTATDMAVSQANKAYLEREHRLLWQVLADRVPHLVPSLRRSIARRRREVEQ